MKKKYIKPHTETVSAHPQVMLVSSFEERHTCDKYCRHWHICRDRKEGIRCYDKIER